MLEKLNTIIAKYEHLREESLKPEIFEDMEKAKKINKELSSLEKTFELATAYKKAIETLENAQEMLASETDPDLLEMAQEELETSKETIETLDQELKIALLPKDPNDEKNIYLEIRPAAGGDEAGLFAGELLKMYLNFAQKKGRKPEIVEEQLSDICGVKFVMVKVAGESVYSMMKFESGVHRVQRIRIPNLMEEFILQQLRLRLCLRLKM